MSDSVSIALSNTDWTDITGGVKYGYFTNRFDQFIVFVEALTKPDASTHVGHRLNPGEDKQFALTGSQKIWGRIVPVLSESGAIVILTPGYNSLTTGGPQSKNFLHEVNQGNVEGHRLLNIKGENSDVGTTPEHVWLAGGSLVYLQSPVTVEVISTDANDTAAGTGARTVRVDALDVNFQEVSFTLSTNGLSASTPSTQQILRINDFEVIEVGTYGGANAGELTLRVSGGGATLSVIETLEGRNGNSHFTIPAGKTGYLLRASITVGAKKESSVHIMVREDADVFTAPFSPFLHTHHWEGFTDLVDETFIANHVIPEKSDIYFMASSELGGANIQIDYDLLLVDN